jgi:hypothetical protein
VENVRLRAGGEQRLLTLGRSDVGRHRDHFGVGRLFQFGRGGFQAGLVAAVDHHLATGLRQCLGAGIA